MADSTPGTSKSINGNATVGLCKKRDLLSNTDFTGWPWQQGQTGNQPERQIENHLTTEKAIAAFYRFLSPT